MVRGWFQTGESGLPAAAAPGARAARDFIEGPSMHGPDRSAREGSCQSANQASSARRLLDRSQSRQPVGLERHIVVQNRDPIRLRRLDSAIHRRGEAEIPPEAQHPRTSLLRPFPRSRRSSRCPRRSLHRTAASAARRLSKQRFQQLPPVPMRDHGCHRHALRRIASSPGTRDCRIRRATGSA